MSKPFTKSDVLHWILQHKGMATEPCVCPPRIHGRGFPERCCWVRYVPGCLALGCLFVLKYTNLPYLRVLGSLPHLADLFLLVVQLFSLGLPGFSTWSKCGLAVKTTCGEYMAPTEIAASIGGSKTVPGFSCNGHLHAKRCRNRHRTHIQGLEGWIWGVEGWTSVS